MTSRYLFRDSVLIAQEHSDQYFDDLSKQDDLMLVHFPQFEHERWAAYRMCWFADHCSYSWSPMPQDTVQQLRSLLLLQKS